MSSHTPGPWKLDAIEGAHWNVDAVDGTAVALAQDNKDPGIRRANARLIAAAPELLEALTKLSERVMDCMGDCPHSVVNLAKDAQAVVTKARN